MDIGSMSSTHCVHIVYILYIVYTECTQGDPKKKTNFEAQLCKGTRQNEFNQIAEKNSNYLKWF